MIRARREARFGVTKDAFPFQVDAVEATKHLPYAAFFHEQGLGKTKIAIDLAMSWLQLDVVDSVMIVTKNGLVENWRKEIGVHTHVTPSILGQDRTDNFFRLNSPARLYVTHYETCKSEYHRLRLFLKTRRVGVILDESHKIKNPTSGVTEALLSLSDGFVRRVIMTGTPVANRPYDIWAQIKFLDGGQALGNDFAVFKARLELSKELADDPRRRTRFEFALRDVFERIRPFCVRETKETAGLSLPTKEIRAILVDLEEIQGELYRNLKNEMRAVIVRDGRPTLDKVDDILKRMLRLVQVASNPKLIDESYDREPGKVAALMDILARAVQEGSKVIVWTSFTANADWLARLLREHGAVRVHGKLTIEARNQALARFIDEPDVRVLVATPGAAKEGLTLTVANYAVFFDRTFSLDDYLQAQDRIHRISQQRECFVLNLIARGTIDEWIDELLGAKHLAAQLLQGDINRDEYQAQATYQFARLFAEVLGIPQENS